MHAVSVLTLWLPLAVALVPCPSLCAKARGQAGEREESGGMVQVNIGSCVMEKIYLTPQYEGQTHVVLKMLVSASDNEAQSNGAMFSEQMLSRSRSALKHCTNPVHH